MGKKGKSRGGKWLCIPSGPQPPSAALHVLALLDPFCSAPLPLLARIHRATVGFVCRRVSGTDPVLFLIWTTRWRIKSRGSRSSQTNL